MKKYKALVPIVLIVCMLLSFYMLVDTRTSTTREYESYLNAARDFAKQEIVVDAVDNYSKALGINDTIEINIEVGEFYLKMDDVVSAIVWGEQLIEKFPKDARAYEFLLGRYKEVNDYNKCYSLNDEIIKRGLATDGITKIMNDIKYEFYYGEAYDNVDVFSKGYCAVEYEGLWGLANEVGDKSAPIKFKAVGPYLDDVAPVITKDEEVYFIDSKGNKKIAIKSDLKAKEASSMVDGVFALYDGSSWVFYNRENKKLSDNYEQVSLMANGYAAVMLDDQWQILDNKFKSINGKKYSDVVQDDRGIIYRNNVMFVSDTGNYYMIDSSGKKVNKETYLDAKLFLDDTYAAVKTDKGWTFIDSSGKQVFKDNYYDNARSFVNGFAAVQKDGRWGYLDSEGNVAIDFMFEEAKDFNSSGCAFVKNEDVWRLIKLYSSNFEI